MLIFNDTYITANIKSDIFLNNRESLMPYTKKILRKCYMSRELALGFTLVTSSSPLFRWYRWSRFDFLNMMPALHLVFVKVKQSQEAEAPIFHANRHMKVVSLSALHTGRLYPHRKYSWYPFLLEAESIPGPQCGRKDYVKEKLQLHHRESNPQPSGL